MTTKDGIDKKYQAQAVLLEAEYFKVIGKGKPSQHRQLKVGKTIDDFNMAHGQIWQNHEAELIAEGYLNPLPVAIPPRDLEVEIDELKAKIEKLERR